MVKAVPKLKKAWELRPRQQRAHPHRRLSFVCFIVQLLHNQNLLPHVMHHVGTLAISPATLHIFIDSQPDINLSIDSDAVLRALSGSSGGGASVSLKRGGPIGVCHERQRSSGKTTERVEPIFLFGAAASLEDTQKDQPNKLAMLARLPLDQHIAFVRDGPSLRNTGINCSVEEQVLGAAARTWAAASCVTYAKQCMYIWP